MTCGRPLFLTRSSIVGMPTKIQSATFQNDSSFELARGRKLRFWFVVDLLNGGRHRKSQAKLSSSFQAARKIYGHHLHNSNREQITQRLEEL